MLLFAYLDLFPATTAGIKGKASRLEA